MRATTPDLALDDVYRPHSFAELEGLVPAPVLSALDPEGVYGVAWSGRVRVRKVSKRAAREGDARPRGVDRRPYRPYRLWPGPLDGGRGAAHHAG